MQVLERNFVRRIDLTSLQLFVAVCEQGSIGKAAEHGITIDGVTLDFGPAMKRSRSVSQQNSKGVEFLLKKNKDFSLRL